MMFLILASVFLAAVSGQVENSDPTKACLPDVLQITAVSLIHDVMGTFVFNFPENKAASRLSSGARNVIDFAANTVTSIDEITGSCVTYPLPDGFKTISSQCLPANATKLISTHIFLDLNPNSVEIEGWEYTIPNYGTVRVALTKSSPGVLVFGQVISPFPGISDVQIYVNPKTTIDDASTFVVPDYCSAVSAFG